MNILAISGSIRTESSNSTLLKAIEPLLGPTKWTDFQIKELPYFDPGLQFGADVPAIVQKLRSLAAQADFLVISTPEYAHGIPGILKNALEWLICEETMKKKVLVFIASPSGGEYVKKYLLETLKTMDLVVSEDTTFVLRSARKDILPNGEISDAGLKTSLSEFLRKSGLIE